MSEGFTVEPETLDTHADVVDATERRIAAQALGAGAGSEAYGVVGRVFSAEVRCSAAQGAEAVRRIRESLRRTARDLREAARSYENADSAAARALERAAGGETGQDTCGPR